MAIERSTAHTDQFDVIFGLVLFDAQTFNMEPLLTAVLALHHDGVFVGDTKPAYAVLFGVIYVDQLCWHLPTQQCLCALVLFPLAAGLLFSRTSHGRIAIFSVHIESLAFLLGLEAECFLGDQRHVLIGVEGVLFAFSLAAQLLTSLITSLFLLLLA